MNKRCPLTGGVLTPPLTKGDANTPFGNPIKRFHAASNMVNVKCTLMAKGARGQTSSDQSGTFLQQELVYYNDTHGIPHDWGRQACVFLPSCATHLPYFWPTLAGSRGCQAIVKGLCSLLIKANIALFWR